MNAQVGPRLSLPEYIGLPTWPDNLPMPDRDGYQYQLGFGLVRTQFSGGSIRQRRTVWSMGVSTEARGVGAGIPFGIFV